jgi:hypothetical protein
VTPSPTATIVPEEPVSRVQGSDLLMVSVSVVIIGAMGFVVGRHDGGTAVSGMRLSLWCWIFGMAGYVLYGIGALDTDKQLGIWGPLLTGIAAGLVPLVVYAILGRLLRRG